MIDFDRANRIGLDYVQSWVPGGRMEGNEYKALNPTRADHKIGSFSINMANGLWSDFADFDEAKGDVVALYAYLFRHELPGSTEQQIQCEAAKAILRKYAGETIEDKPYKVKSENSAWTGYHQLHSGCEKLPKFDVSWHEKYSAKKPFERSWDFLNKRGRVVLRIARFRDDEGKVDKPFTLWQKDKVIKWRSIDLQSKTPLYNLQGLMNNESLPVLLTEGQKNAEDSRELLAKHLTTTAVYGKIGGMDLEPLRGRKVFIWRDPDSTGRKKASKLKKELEDIDCFCYFVDSPDGKEKWDISDAIQEGWSVSRLVEYVKSFEKEEPIEQEIYLDDGFPFKVFAVSPGYIYIYNSRNRLIEKHKTNSLGKSTLISLMCLEKWQKLFPGDKGPVWDAAIDEILTISENCPLWNPSLVRGAGAWRDTGGKIVCSTGESLIIDDKEIGLMDYESKYVYQRGASYRPYSRKDPMNKEESSRFLELFNSISFEEDLHKIMLAGWAFLAPFCGILNWRPAIWLTGGPGSGKTHVQQKIINCLMEEFSEKVVANGSTEAGIRQRLNNCSIPITIDEMESNDKNSKETVQLLLSMARQASSGGINSPEILKGTQDQMGSSFRINSMFFFASILASVEHGADMDRIEILELKTPKPSQMQERKNQFAKLLSLEEDILTPDFKQRFYSRALNIIEETLIAIDVFVSLASDILQSQRGGDQKGTLLAGAYMITHDVAPTKEQALLWVKDIDLKGAMDFYLGKTDEEKCLDIILSHHIEIPTLEGRQKQTIWMWIENCLKREGDYSNIQRQLVGYGIRVNANNTFDLACNYDYIRKILRETPWSNTYAKLLKRHPDIVLSKDVPKTARFNGSGKGILRFKIDDCPF